MSEYVVIRMTRQEALAHGLLICECGYPENNHFDFDNRVCAHNKECKGYKEKATAGTILKPIRQPSPPVIQNKKSKK